MSYPTNKKISLDVYNNSIVGFNAKQGDIGSRYIEITCTEHGKKIVLDSETVKAYVRYKKPDGKVGFVDAVVREDGIVYVEITKQMLAVSGRCDFDVILAYASGHIEMDDSYGDLIITDTSIISTMPFYINVLSSTFDNTILNSVNDFSALDNAITNTIAISVAAKDAEDIRQKTFDDSMLELDTYLGDLETLEEGIKNVFGEETDTIAEGTMYGVMNKTIELIGEGNSVIEETQGLLGTQNDEAGTNTLYGLKKELEATIVEGDGVAKRAEAAAEKCENIADGIGVVYVEDIANNLTTTETGKVLDATQGKELLAMITALQESIVNMPKVHTGTTDPDNALGNNGDYYLKLLEE